MSAGKKETGFSSSMTNSDGETMWKPWRSVASPFNTRLAPRIGDRNQRASLSLLWSSRS